jgi:hypothetical protein
MFTHIRNNTQLKHIKTQAAYAQLIKDSFSENNTTDTVVDCAFILPDYYSSVTPCIDPKFSHYCKGDEAIHVFLSTAVSISFEYDQGVCTKWRHYDADSYAFIVPDDDKPIGIRCVKRKCSWFPEATAEKPAGVQLMHRYVDPRGFLPAPFVSDSHTSLWQSHEEVKATYQDAAVLSEWRRWAEGVFPENGQRVCTCGKVTAVVECDDVDRLHF